ncbi:hypothetical protein [Leucothrix mucor]|uniref:hypothetical protein n=1 Tax=Leucothrix mucor TaxID=45248 RepID=UPI0003B5DEB5|nr:hypothetical protein [Leucothrix mucor]
MSSELSQELYALYKKYESDLYEFGERSNEIVHGPFLISPNDKFSTSKVRVVFIGQETNGWSCKKDISNQMETYSKFNLGEKYVSSPFWNVIRKFEKSIIGETHSSSWLNINRYDENSKKPSNENRELLSGLDTLLLSELKILKPDVTIFLTGHSYDSRIIPLLSAQKTSIGEFDQKQVCEMITNSIGGRVFRTYHPNYLRRSGLESRVISEICSQVNV